MTFVKKLKSRFKLALRRVGFLCKRSKPQTHRIRISRTLNPDGTTTYHDRLTKQPINNGNTFESELHIWKEIHKNVKLK